MYQYIKDLIKGLYNFDDEDEIYNSLLMLKQVKIISSGIRHIFKNFYKRMYMLTQMFFTIP